MVDDRRLSDEDRKARDDRIRQWHKDYNARPEVIERRKQYYKKYSKSKDAKESHREAQARYRRTAKGRACDDRYWKNRRSRPKDNKEDNDKDS